MGTVIFPAADPEDLPQRKRRHTRGAAPQAIDFKGIPANIDSLRADLEARDARDKNRSVSPLKPAEDAVQLDNSDLSIDATVEAVLNSWQQRRPFV